MGCNMARTKTDAAMLAASKRYDDKVDHLRVRLPQGLKKQVQDYVDTLPQYAVKGKNHGSVNRWLTDLIRREMERE